LSLSPAIQVGRNATFGKEGYVIRKQANAKVTDNPGFEVDHTPWLSAAERRKARPRKK